MTLAEPSRRERKKEETRRRIFEAAVELFRSKGFEATTVDEITEKADVGRGTFFNYFPKKESVLAYLSEERLAAAEDNAAALLAEPAPARGKLIDLFLHAASAWDRDVELSRFVFQEWLKTAFAASADADKGWRQLVRALIEQGKLNGELRRDIDAARADAVLSSVYIATLFHWLACPEDCRDPNFTDLRQELTRRLGLVVDGLAPRGAEAKP